jgi:hypothetical protein
MPYMVRNVNHVRHLSSFKFKKMITVNSKFNWYKMPKRKAKNQK